MPDHPKLIQLFVWQTYDVAPAFPELHRFLATIEDVLTHFRDVIGRFPADERAEIAFAAPQWALTPGQSVVLYESRVCLGGGIIL